MARKSVEETLQELMQFCEQQEKTAAKTAVSQTGWRRHLHAAITAAFTNVHTVLGNVTPAQTKQPNEQHEQHS